MCLWVCVCVVCGFHFRPLHVIAIWRLPLQIRNGESQFGNSKAVAVIIATTAAAQCTRHEYVMKVRAITN